MELFIMSASFMYFGIGTGMALGGLMVAIARNDSSDYPEKPIPVNTLKIFRDFIEITITWPLLAFSWKYCDWRLYHENRKGFYE